MQNEVEESIESSKKVSYPTLLIITLVLGFILRIINAKTRPLFGDPPHFLIAAINFFDSGLLVVWDQSTYLWYAFTNIFYEIFGITQFSSRFASILLGTLSILVIYLFTLEFSKNKKVALVAAILYALAPGIIWHASDEQDICAIFFILAAFYTLIKGLNTKSKYYIIFSGIIFGVASMWKAYTAILLIPYLGFIYYYHRTKRINLKKDYKPFLIAICFIMIIVSPVFVYNYLNYQHNEVVDFLFATVLKIKNPKIISLYGWTAGQEIYSSGGLREFFHKMFIDGNLASDSDNIPLMVRGLSSFYSNGKILTLLMICSFIFLYLKRKQTFAKDYLIFFSLYLFIPVLVIIHGNYLSKHLVQFLIFSLPMTSYFLVASFNTLKHKSGFLNKLTLKKYFPYIAYAAVFLFLFFVILSLDRSPHHNFFSQNPEGKLIDYKLSNIPENALVIYDDRIYNSLAGWLFNDRYYIPVSLTNTIVAYSQNSSNSRSTSVYIVECVIDDCGWGTVSSNPQLNSSMENFFGFLKNQSIPEVFSVNSKLTGATYYNPLISPRIETGKQFSVYKTQMNLDHNIMKQIKLQYEYFLYPLGYENKQTENFKKFTYTPQGFFENLLDNIAWFIFYLNIVLSFIIIAFIIFEAYIRI